MTKDKAIAKSVMALSALVIIFIITTGIFGMQATQAPKTVERIVTQERIETRTVTQPGTPGATVTQRTTVPTTITQTVTATAVRTVTETGAAPTPARVKVNLATPLTSASPSQTHYYYAADKYWKELGLDVEVQFLRGSAAPIPAVVGGSSQMGSGGFSTPYSAIEGGAPIRIIIGMSHWPVYYLMGKPEFKKISDLKGKTVGVAAPGDLFETSIIPLVFKPAGLIEPGKDFTIVYLGSMPERARALLVGRVDSTFLIPDNLIAFPDLNKFSTIALVAKPALPWDAIFTSKDYMDKNPSVVERFVKGYILASREIAVNKNAFIEVNKKWKSMEAPQGMTLDQALSKVWEAYAKWPGGYFPVNGMEKDIMLPELKALKDLGIFKKIEPVGDFIEFKFVDKAVAELGRWPQDPWKQ